jgi:hypothetical protein
MFLWFQLIVSNQSGAGEISWRSLVLMVEGSMNLLVEPHNTIDLWFLETADANQRRSAFWKYLNIQ